MGGFLTWTQNMHQSTWDHEMLSADGPSKDKRLLVRSFLLKKTGNTNAESGLKLKLIFYFVSTIHEPLHVDKLSLVQ
jgi:hypothetical protein